MPDSSPNADKVYAEPRPQVEAFAFDAQVAAVFDDMIRRSVPGYGMTLSLLSIIAHRYATSGSRIYDLGCSLGAGLLAMGSRIDLPEVELIGVDNSAAMLDRCRQNTAAVSERHPLELRCEDIQQTEIRNASIVALNFTLQFIQKDRRTDLLKRVHDGLAPNGVLVLSEKIRFEDPRIQGDLSALHHDFKRANGYSDLEISQKRSALEKVLIPESLGAHSARLKEAGFSRSEIWFQCFNFASLLAFR